MRRTIIYLLLLCVSSLPINPVFAEDDYVDETESTWGAISSDDGFEKLSQSLGLLTTLG